MSRGDTAIITGASRGLGLALAGGLASLGWRLVIDARGEDELRRAARELSEFTHVHALVGDVAEAAHRQALVAAAGERIDLLVNNASVLGPSPQPELASYPLGDLERVFRINVWAPLALIQLALPRISGGCVINVTSDAAVEPYPGWGGYGSSKAALEQLTAVLGAEHPDLRVYAVDPGDMRTRMHQEAFPGQDISDRPLPEQSVPGLLGLINGSLPSARYRASEFVPVDQ
jgi:NAD(P)-dependent dehydrogenase (short-subunit alcohol dehydrogenase family)